MVRHELFHVVKRGVYIPVLIFVTAFFVVGTYVGSGIVHAGTLPSEIDGLKMGTSSAGVVEKIKAVGKHSTEPIPRENRSKLIWVLADNPQFKDVVFYFTEKDRLYLIRFNLTDAARMNFYTLKKNIFKEYDFSWERPFKMRIGDEDVSCYGPEHGMSLYFLEFSNRKTNDRAFELFSRPVSAEDKPKSKKAKADKPAALFRPQGDDKQAPQEKKPEVQDKPTAEKKPELQRQPAAEKKPEAEAKPAGEKKPEAQAKPASENKPEAKAKPAAEKKP